MYVCMYVCMYAFIYVCYDYVRMYGIWYGGVVCDCSRFHLRSFTFFVTCFDVIMYIATMIAGHYYYGGAFVKGHQHKPQPKPNTETETERRQPA